ncbi:unnamed protein product [Chondrus crispus]|uniref:Uncharacterized protein n=1 Tax=Chondrus crispus TaxID=2769 RepID=R7QMS8_CHOCR|nr:unnamed protein product [Chondrus crispus]CDF38690.1 unnamed protein product [Chondrus crispus]|eukprot:XP_005718595.1 unnamed protein product [Chondrus crispus]
MSHAPHPTTRLHLDSNQIPLFSLNAVKTALLGLVDQERPKRPASLCAFF